LAIKSVEEQVEDIAKQQLASYKIRYFSKNESINSEIDEALRKAQSKSGGSGGNYPDIRLLLKSSYGKQYPIMIEVKGSPNKLIRTNASGAVDNTNSASINSYAVNGAVHYAKAITDNTVSYKEAIAVGINGYEEANALKIELEVYYISDTNFGIPKKIANYSDLSFLATKHFDSFAKQVEQLKLTPAEVEAQSRKVEEQIERSLKDLNQTMQDNLQISVGSRVELITGMIMAGLGIKGKVDPLEITDLKGQTGENSNDGKIIISKIADYLSGHNLPPEKKQMIVNDLARVFLYSGLSDPKDKGESKLKTVYSRVYKEILPIFTSSHHLDFTGKLFNVLNEWVDIPDSDRNDVVLTPRYVTTMMAKLAGVNRDSCVWDYAVGSAGFLISSMKLMIEDAEKNIHSPDALRKKIADIKRYQLLGIEKRSDIYMLAVLNMILMGDGSTNILHMNSLTDYDGNYEQGDNKDLPFPANVFLLNPPYSAEGKGFIFVKKALDKMSSGKAAILIQENAGSGMGMPFTKDLLRKHTLLASIHMADIFRGKSGVQTAVYLFDVNKPHDLKQIVRFINMTNDGYSRQNRKKSSLNVNLRNTDHAVERYQEVVDLVHHGRKYLLHFKEVDFIEDTITLNGDDWTFSQHKAIDTIPTEADFMKTVSEYLAWEVGRVLKGEFCA